MYENNNNMIEKINHIEFDNHTILEIYHPNLFRLMQRKYT